MLLVNADKKLELPSSFYYTQPMIKYALQCHKNHQFEGWFSSSADYDDQAKRGLLSCPICDSDKIEKALMAPNIGRKSNQKPAKLDLKKLEQMRQDYNQKAEQARQDIEKNFDNVGQQFPEEARRMHYGEAKERQIFGEATGKEVKELQEEGIELAPVPQQIPSPAEVKKRLN